MSSDKANQIVKDAAASMDKSLKHLESELAKIRAGKASTSIFDSIMVDYYGMTVPMHQSATLTTPDARTIVIQPFEKSMLKELEKAIMLSNLSLNPSNDGTVLRITIPPLTEERRKDLAKQSKQKSEDAKISVRNIRRDANDALKKLVKDGLAQDECKTFEDAVQKETDAYIIKIEKLLEAKEKEIMTV